MSLPAQQSRHTKLGKSSAKSLKSAPPPGLPRLLPRLPVRAVRHRSPAPDPLSSQPWSPVRMRPEGRWPWVLGNTQGLLQSLTTPEAEASLVLWMLFVCRARTVVSTQSAQQHGPSAELQHRNSIVLSLGERAASRWFAVESFCP